MIIPPDDSLIKSQAQDREAKARNTSGAGLIPELPLAPGSPLLPGVRALFAGEAIKGLRKAEHKFAEPNKHFLLWHQHCSSRLKLPLELSQLQALAWH